MPGSALPAETGSMIKASLTEAGQMIEASPTEADPMITGSLAENRSMVMIVRMEAGLTIVYSSEGKRSPHEPSAGRRAGR